MMRTELRIEGAQSDSTRAASDAVSHEVNLFRFVVVKGLDKQSNVVPVAR